MASFNVSAELTGVEKMAFDLIVTIGPATADPELLARIDETAPCIYRFNGAHLNGSTLRAGVKSLRTILSGARVLVDLPGRKIRTRGLVEPVRLEPGKTIQLRPDQVNFPDFYRCVDEGDRILTSSSLIELFVESVADKVVTLRCGSSGFLGNNKGLHIPDERRQVPSLFEDDIELLEASAQIPGGINYLGLSYVHGPEDLEEMRVLMERSRLSARLISKIETRAAIEHLEEILSVADLILVDRGDLSAEIGLLELPDCLRRVSEAAKRSGIPVYFATEFLASMQEQKLPLISELVDLHRTISDGARGIQLSEETAIGKYPLRCVQTVADVLERARRTTGEVSE
jgi:pyruvate kinase